MAKYSEADTRANYIDPALKAAHWQPNNIIREYYFTDGRKLAGGVRGRRCFVDYLLHKDNRYLAVVEAKKESEHPTKGLQQAIDYAKKLLVRFVYSSNGKQTYEFDLETGKGDYIEFYPTPQELENRYMGVNSDLGQQLRNVPFHLEGAMQPRYYQELAVHAATDAIGKGKPRVLLTLATGTGKTFIAFQIVHKLFQSRWNKESPGTRRPRILFLADRNILADQAINTFNPYEKDLIKINGEEVRKRGGVVPTNAHIFFAIYQAIAERENIEGYYKAYPSDFFDLVMIDECHRGSANETGSWRAILDHFGSAVHVGLTATPKREANVDTYDYFGTPAFEYSLKDGINDGFLTPYRVKRVRTNLDELVLTKDDQVVEGESGQDVYQVEDYDKKIVVDERTELVAKAILDNINPLEKTIVFCENQNHALTMRDMINKHKELKDPHYCVRVTSDEGKVGRELLEKFQDNDKDIPTIITSSQMLTTGVDARNVRNVVLDRTVEPTPPPDTPEPPEGTDGPEPEPGEPKPRLKVKLGKHRELKVIDVETRYIDENGKPLTVQEFVERLITQLPGLFKSVEELRQIWSDPDERETLLGKLVQAGFDKEQLATLRRMFEAEECDIFDLLAFLAFEQPMATRKARADQVRTNSAFFNQYQQEKAQQFLHFVLNRYEQTGSTELSRERLPALIELSGLGTVKDASTAFGGKPAYLLAAFKQLQQQLYHVN
jgi:type I restriction enzyme R subunit